MEEVPDEVELAPAATGARAEHDAGDSGPRIKSGKKPGKKRAGKAEQGAITSEQKAVKRPKKVPRNKKNAGFSETQWFMAGAKKDADILEAKAEDAEYAHDEYGRDENITEEERKDYTLRTPEE